MERKLRSFEKAYAKKCCNLTVGEILEEMRNAHFDFLADDKFSIMEIKYISWYLENAFINELLQDDAFLDKEVTVLRTDFVGEDRLMLFFDEYRPGFSMALNIEDECMYFSSARKSTYVETAYDVYDSMKIRDALELAVTY